jgi:ribosomal protein S18 acetylase RimI-like enzyme
MPVDSDGRPGNRLVEPGDLAHTPGVGSVAFRTATSVDATAVATLHAESWRRHYRGAYADSFLDGDVVGDRLTVWSGRLEAPSGESRTVLAEEQGRLVGFVHTVLGADPTWGALVDNLHVDVTHQRHGIGRALLARSAAFAVESAPAAGLFLWVLEQNVAAQHFYAAVGGVPVESKPVPDVGGRSGRLNGSPRCLRYVWRDPRALV